AHTGRRSGEPGSRDGACIRRRCPIAHHDGGGARAERGSAERCKKRASHRAPFRPIASFDGRRGRFDISEFRGAREPSGARETGLRPYNAPSGPTRSRKERRLTRTCNRMTAKIIYTLTDEAPALATYSLLPIVQAFARAADVTVETRDISLAGRILAQFPDYLPPERRCSDDLAYLGELAQTPEANIIKLPNISASVPQLTAAIKELQSQGYPVPDYPEEPKNDTEREIKARYAKVLGSAVNPVLREGNSDRRVAAAVKQYAKTHPHSMGEWSPDSKSHVAHMTAGDFYGSEQSAVIERAGRLRIELVGADGNVTVLKPSVEVLDGEVVSMAAMSCRKLREFYDVETRRAKEQGVLLSLHLKATMMKVSDPIMFGHAVTVYSRDVFEEHAALFEEIGGEPNNGIGDVYAKIESLPEAKRKEIEADIEAVYRVRPPLAMVDSDKGITNLHVPSNVIIDASMPAAIRASGKMWGPDGKLHDTKALIPDRCYAGIYQAVIDDCKRRGAFDVRAMGNV